jgi:hypothetical protein
MMTRNEIAALLGTSPVTHKNAHYWVKFTQEQADFAIDRTLLFQELSQTECRLTADYKQMFSMWLDAVKRGSSPR